MENTNRRETVQNTDVKQAQKQLVSCVTGVIVGHVFGIGGVQAVRF